MNLFNWLKNYKMPQRGERDEDTTLSKETFERNAYNSLLLAVIESLESIVNSNNTNRSKEAYLQLKRMESLGLQNSANAKALRQQATPYINSQRNREIIYAMERIWDKLGKNAIIIQTNHFIDVLSRYNLVCGFMQDYVGAIPENALISYETAHQRCKGNRILEFDSLVANNLCPYGLPWIPNRPYNLRKLNSGNPFCIAAPYKCFNRVQSQEMLDPFIFSCSSEHDLIIIHSMWGAEAEDSIIKRYEQLRDTIISMFN